MKHNPDYATAPYELTFQARSGRSLIVDCTPHRFIVRPPEFKDLGELTAWVMKNSVPPFINED